jgi:hypothetical protein
MNAGGRRPLVNRAAAGCNREAMDDDELIAALAAGDDAALRELFTRHAPWLAARLRAALPPPDVEDRPVAEVATLLGVPAGVRVHRRPRGRLLRPVRRL